MSTVPHLGKTITNNIFLFVFLFHQVEAINLMRILEIIIKVSIEPIIITVQAEIPVLDRTEAIFTDKIKVKITIARAMATTEANPITIVVGDADFKTKLNTSSLNSMHLKTSKHRFIHAYFILILKNFKYLIQ